MAGQPWGRGEPLYLYRWYDRSGVLLYVGVTNYASARRGAHRSVSWWCMPTHQPVYDAPSFTSDRELASRIELGIIRAEEPVFNRRGADPRIDPIGRMAAYIVAHGGPGAFRRQIPADVLERVPGGSASWTRTGESTVVVRAILDAAEKEQ